jgi:uncharacterized LabA/DUF88 family protein
MDRVAIFVDGSNFYHALKGRFGHAKIRFDALARVLTNRAPDRTLLRVYYYNAAYDQVADSKAYAKQQRFFDSLRRTPYLALNLGRLERRPPDWSGIDAEGRRQIEAILGEPLPEYTYVEKGVDVQLAVDMVKLAVANTYEVAVLVSADGDFAPAVELVKQLGKHVEVAYVEGCAANLLRDVCAFEIVIGEHIMDQCRL